MAAPSRRCKNGFTTSTEGDDVEKRVDLSGGTFVFVSRNLLPLRAVYRTRNSPIEERERDPAGGGHDEVASELHLSAAHW